MNVLVVKDGTVPILVAEVFYADVTDIDEVRDRTDGGDLELEVFEVEGRPEGLDISWADGDGFTVYGTTLGAWLHDRQDDETGGPIEEIAAGSFVQSDISRGDDAGWYSHFYDLRGQR